MSKLATLYIVSAPSGAGKTSLLKSMLQDVDDVCISISHTTRPQRAGEQNGVDYHFIPESEFKKMIADDAFLEYAEVFGNYYGTSKLWVEEQLAKGTDIILEIDWQGARQMRQLMPESRTIFVLPPSLDELEKRLHGRGQDEASVIAKRMAAAKEEMSHYKEYDYLVVNDDFETAKSQVKSILAAERQACKQQIARYGDLISDLLA